MVDIVHRIGIKAPAEKIYQALTSLAGLAGWWTEDVTGTEEAGGTIRFTFRSETGDVKGFMVMQVEGLDANSEVRWRCVDGPEEWIGTVITFRLVPKEQQTIVQFAHRKWREEVEFTAHCSMKWATFLLSLRDYVETGRGKPSPQDLKIDDWN